MANTLDDVVVTAVWQDLYVLSGVAATTSIIVENKGSDSILLAEGTQPLAASVKGMSIDSGEFAQITGSPTNIWAKSCNGYTCPVYVEVV